MSEVKDIREELLKKEEKKPVQIKDLLSTGSTLLNLACSGKWQGGFAKGKYFFLVGDSSSGKTFLAMTCFAEATQNKEFENYRLIYDDVEIGALMDVEKFFGSKVAERLEPPSKEDGLPVYSQDIDQFYFHLFDALSHKRPCIYVLDSMDALSSKYEQSKFQERKKEHEGGAKAKGDYGDGKAKANSRSLRAMLGMIQSSGSILIIINQTRDNIDAGMFEPAKTRSGGHALTFYACLEIWSSVKTMIKKAVNGIDLQVGVIAKVRVKKNRLCGKDRTVEIPIYHSYGIDDLGACVDYIIAQGHWKPNKQGVIKADEFNFEGKRGSLLKKIEDEGLEKDLRVLAAEVWNSVEEKLVLPRKKRYD